MIDWRVITDDFEGGLRTTAYVPEDKDGVIGHSGVTIGGGVDLGGRDAAELRNIGVPPELIELLQPYLGLQGAAADAFLSAHPLRLTRANAMTLTELVKADIVADVSRAYERGSEKKWEDLPDRAQTVIASLAFNFGPQLWLEYKTTWGLILANNWTGLSSYLFRYPSKQKELARRRRLESIHLRPLFERIPPK